MKRDRLKKNQIFNQYLFLSVQFTDTGARLGSNSNSDGLRHHSCVLLSLDQLRDMSVCVLPSGAKDWSSKKSSNPKVQNVSL